MMGYLMITSLRVYCCIRWWKKCENWSTFGEVMGKSKSRVSCFFTHELVLV